MIGIYHSKDLDGYCSGAIMKLKYPDIKLIGMDYGEKPPENPNHEPVIICDMSFPMVDMAEIAKQSNGKLTWIDHHKSAINDFMSYFKYDMVRKGFDHIKVENFGDVILQDGIAACEIAWNYFFKNSSIHEMPRAVELLGKYDTWRNQNKEEWENTIMPFQYGMRMICNNAETFPTVLFSGYAHNYIVEILTKGKTILEYQSQQNEKACKLSAFEYEFEGFRAICLNIGGGNSTMFNSIYNPDKHDIMITFVFNSIHWTYTLFTAKKDIDCSEIAKKYGGGGHKGAAGFKIKELIFNTI